MLAPSRANARAIAWPIPLLAPVTSATLPSSLPIVLTVYRIERPDWTANVFERQSGEVRAGDPRPFKQDDPGGDRLECRSKVALALEADHAEGGRLDAVCPKDVEVDRGFGPSSDQDIDVCGCRRSAAEAAAEHGRWPQIDRQAGHHRPVVDVPAVRDEPD